MPYQRSYETFSIFVNGYLIKNIETFIRMIMKNYLLNHLYKNSQPVFALKDSGVSLAPPPGCLMISPNHVLLKLSYYFIPVCDLLQPLATMSEKERFDNRLKTREHAISLIRSFFSTRSWYSN